MAEKQLRIELDYTYTYDQFTVFFYGDRVFVGKKDYPGRVYIYYTLEEIQNDLRCAHGKAVKLLAELDKGKGFSLIERVKQGQGRPTQIYVKRFTTRNVPPPPPQPEPESDPEPRPPIFGIADFRKP